MRQQQEAHETCLLYTSLQLFAVVGHLHAQTPPIIHRDIKPDNILIDKGHVVLIDFEIAKLMTTRKDVQRSGSVGSVSYTHLDVYKRQDRTGIMELLTAAGCAVVITT